MKQQDFDGTRERAVLTSMIVNKTVLGRIAAKWQGRDFASRWANLIGSWCVEFYHKHGDAPGKGIVNLYTTWARKNRDEDTTRLVERFLEGLSDEWSSLKEETHPGQMIDLAGEHFNYVRLSCLKEALEVNLKAGDLKKAHEDVSLFDWQQLGAGAHVDCFLDHDATLPWFDEKTDAPVIQWPGDLETFFQDSFKEDDFVSFIGPEKSGKTFLLIESAYLAVTQRKRTAFFEVGDMTERQIGRRLLMRAAAHPWRAKKVYWPTDLEVSRTNDDARPETALVTGEDLDFAQGLNWKTASERCQDLMAKIVRSKRSYFRLSCHPAGSLSVEALRSILHGWALEGWKPRVVVVDYAELLAPPAGAKDRLDIIDKNWQQLRALTQELKCLLVTATQSNAEGYGRWLLTMRNFSGNKAKLAHVTGMIGINATDAEKSKQLKRFNWVVLREGEYSPERCCHAAGCLDLCQPVVLAKVATGKKT